MSFASPAATQRRLGDRLEKQRLKNGKKEHEIEHQMLSWLWCDLDAKGTTWSLSTALHVGSTKPTYDRWKTSGEFGWRVRQTREQVTWSIMLLVMVTKLRCLSWKSSARELGVSQQLHQPWSGVFGHQWTTKRKRMAKMFDMFHDGKEKLTVHQIPRLVKTRISPWNWLGPSLSHARPSLMHYQALDNTFSASWWTGQPMLVTKKMSWLCFCTALGMPLPKKSLHVLATCRSIAQEKLMPVVCFRVSMRPWNLWAWKMYWTRIAD